MKKYELPHLILGLAKVATMIGLFGTLILMIVTFTESQKAMAADWPQWRGPDRNDISRETGLLTAWPKDGPRLLWTFSDAGTGFSSMAVVGNRLYTLGADDKNEYIFAVDLKNREKVWSTEIGPRFDNPWGDGPRGTPTVDGDRIYAIGGQGILICVETAGGKKVWSKSFKSDLKGQMMSGWGYTESPLIDGDVVVGTPGGKSGAIAAFDKKTGDLKWRSTDFTDPAAYASLVVADVGVRQYVQMTGESMAAVAAKDGKLLWRHPRKSGTAAIPTPIVSDNHVYATSGYGPGCCMVQLNSQGQGIKDDEVYNNKNMTNQHGGVVLVGGHVYGFSDSGFWVCQDFKTGEIVWKDRGIGKGSVVYADGFLYCYAERDGTVALVEANPAGYKERGRFQIPQKTQLPRKRGQIWTHPVISNGKLFLRDQDLIFCYDISKNS